MALCDILDVLKAGGQMVLHGHEASAAYYLVLSELPHWPSISVDKSTSAVKNDGYLKKNTCTII